MASRVESQNSTLPIRLVRQFLRETSKTESRVPCTVMADHNGPISELWWGIIHPNIEVPGRDRHLDRLLEISCCR